MSPELELVTTGAELLNGGVVNGHARWLGAALHDLGWTLRRDTTVPDDSAAIRDALVEASRRCAVVIVTGGLGPTTDDVTREVAAEWLGAKLIMHEPSRRHVVEAYRRRNKPLNAMVERHALVVEGAGVLENRHGLAPGEHLEREGRHVFLLPGPPREFQGVMRDHVLPWLEALGVARSGRRAVFQVSGMGESDIAAALNARGFAELALEVAYCAMPARVTVRLSEQPGAESDFDQGVALVRDVLGRAVYSEQDETVEETVFQQLRARAATVAVAESCTGGMIGERITALPGSSAVFCGGVIAYANEVKVSVLGVDAATLAAEGAVSAAVARGMAEGVRERLRADYGVAVTGIAGPDGGTPEKPVGLVFIAVAGPEGTEVDELRLGGGRGIIREASATLALDLLRRRLGYSSRR